MPFLPFAHGAEFVLLRRAADSAGWIELARLHRPARAGAPSARVVAIRPDVEEVPENLLRLSVAFSATMEEGGAAGRVRLEGPAGAEIVHVLLPMPPELWDRVRRRLTLLLEPGRIKRGLVPNRELGAPLSALAGFDVVVDASIRDAAGGALASGARRTYRVGPPVRSRVDPARWVVSWPGQGTTDALVVVFERPLDHALALRCLQVRGREGAPASGTAEVDGGETRWTFRPAAPWPPHGVRLHIDTALEDLAGQLRPPGLRPRPAPPRRRPPRRGRGDPRAAVRRRSSPSPSAWRPASRSTASAAGVLGPADRRTRGPSGARALTPSGYAQ